MSLNIIQEDDKKMKGVINEKKEKAEKMEYNFCDELIEKIGINELKSNALYYQLDMFINACEMDIKEGGYNRLCEGSKGFKRVYKDYLGDTVKYHFEISKNLAVKDESLKFSGTYNDLVFSFDNYYKEKKLGEDIKPIPFLIQLRKEIGNKSFSMVIGIYKGQTQYSLSIMIDIPNEQVFKHMDFYSKRNDLESSFEIIHSFIENPELLFNAYECVLSQKRINFDRGEIDLIEKDDLLVTNKGKVLKKVLK